LRGGLTKDDLQRYEREWQRIRSEGHRGEAARIEHTNWWLPGIIAYWSRGSVMRDGGDSQEVEYGVSRTRGVGPLAALYAAETYATFDAQGRRLSGTWMGSLLWGHLAMFHRSDVVRSDGRRQRSTSMHFIHHAISIHHMDGHIYVSLFSMPNPIGVVLPARHANHLK
jgi:hypothetical protein